MKKTGKQIKKSNEKIFGSTVDSEHLFQYNEY